MMAAMMRDLPLHAIASFSQGQLGREALEGIVDSLNSSL